MTRYLIVGAGAVGATLAAQLQESGRSTVLVARGENLARLRSDGLRYIRPEGTRTVQLPVVGGPDELQLQADDVLVIATKSQDTEAIIAQWAWVPVKLDDGRDSTAAESLPVVLLQNGLENERVALRRFARVVGAVIAIPSVHLQPGEVSSPGTPVVGLIWLGHYPSGATSDAPDLNAITADLIAAGFGAEVVENIARLKAAKLIGNLGNALDALYEPSPLREQVARALRSEGRDVLTGAGQPVGDLQREGTLDLAGFIKQPVAADARPGSSTWQSLSRSAGVETDFLNGEIVLLGRLFDVPAPLNAAAQIAVNRAAGSAQNVRPGALTDRELARAFPSVARARVLITPVDLAIPKDNRVILDVRWALGDPNGHQHYVDAHVPGARFVDLETELAGHGVPTDGRHPLPSIDSLQQAAQSWGINAGDQVVVYDNSSGTAAARAWWLLRWAGIADVRILDGGLAAWISANQPVETGDSTSGPLGDVVLTAGNLGVVDADQAAELARTGLLLDARAGERYRGEVEPIDPRAGHIPGAVSAPTGENLSKTGDFRSVDELSTRFSDLGATPGATVGVYCGSGVTAAHQIAALAVVGIDAVLFPGSWSAWSSDENRPAATGADPS